MSSLPPGSGRWIANKCARKSGSENLMRIVIPDDYQNMVDRLDCYNLIRHHEITRYREPARNLDHLVERLADADVVVSIREGGGFSRALLDRVRRVRCVR